MVIQECGTIQEYEMIEDLTRKCLLNRPSPTILVNITEAKENETERES